MTRGVSTPHDVCTAIGRHRDDDTEPVGGDDLPPMRDLQRWLDQAEQLVTSDDPHARQRGYANAASLYGELARHTDDPTWAKAAMMAGQMCGVLASQVRFEHGIPTPDPKTEAHNLHLGSCAHCGRPWQGSLDGACEYCPRLLFGATPETRDQAERLPVGRPTDLADLHAPPSHDD
jgi:hypothetical protein